MVEELRNTTAFIALGRKLHGGCAVHHSRQRYYAGVRLAGAAHAQVIHMATDQARCS
jgi:hypothetical protein